MFVIVKFGDNESLVVNPRCVVINLLTSIKRRAGLGNTAKIIDLSDENGLIKDLDVHKFETADKFLTSHETYILVQKERLHQPGGSPVTPPAQFTYWPLLDRCVEQFPNFRIHLADASDNRKKSRVRSGLKSPSPAGKLIGRAGRKPEVGAAKKTSKRR
ncbi:hypothetical protein BsWGS_10609 [Bradybaena similaris]